jgi:hypothetical protein
MPVKKRHTAAAALPKPTAPHDKRHERGVLEPGKRVTKQRSDSQLYDHVINASSSPRVSSTEPTIKNEEESFSQLGAFGTDAEIEGSSGMPSEQEVSTSVSREGSSEDLAGPVSNGRMDPGGSAFCVTESNAQTGTNGHCGKVDTISTDTAWNPMELFLGIYRRRDILAVLLLLLQLPTALLMVVQVIFISLTIGTSSIGWTVSSISSPSEWWTGSSGNPSLMTTLAADVLFLGFYSLIAVVLPSWSSLILDLAQPVIATSLFGAGTGFTSGWNDSMLCFLIVGIPHIANNFDWKYWIADPVVSLLARTGLESSKLARLAALHSLQHSSHNWVRLVLEIHIITHGLVRIIRRAAQSRAGPDMHPTSSGAFPPIELNQYEGARSTASDGRPPGLPPVIRDGKEKLVSGKRRRRQTNTIRNQQPFWASVATSKITITKDVEQAHIQRDTFEATSDKTIIEDVKREGAAGRVWITRVDTTEITFSALLTGIVGAAGEVGATDNLTELQRLKIMVNDTVWPQVAFRQDDSDGVEGVSGKIFGLTPGERFFIEFWTAGDIVVYSAQVLTRAAAISDAVATVAATVQDSLRPSSPTTTLHKAIAAAEAQLAEVKIKGKKNRKEHKNAHSKLERENDGLEAKLSSFTMTDDKLRQRQTQIRQNIKQAEDAAVAINAQLDGLAAHPESEVGSHEATKDQWEKERDRRAKARRDFEASKAENDRKIQAAHNEIQALRQKRERLEARLTRLEQQKDTLATANLNMRKENAQWVAQRTHALEYQASEEQKLRDSIAYTDEQIQHISQRRTEIERNTFHHPLSMATNGQTSSNHTPEPAYSALSPTSRLQGYNGYSGYSSFGGYGTGSPLGHSRQNSVRNRPRRSSMLSDVSGFTEGETGIEGSPTMEDMPAAPGFTMPPMNSPFRPPVLPITSSPSVSSAIGANIPRASSTGSSVLGGSAMSPPPGLHGSGNSSGPPPSPVLPIGHEVGKGSPRVNK